MKKIVQYALAVSLAASSTLANAATYEYSNRTARFNNMIPQAISGTKSGKEVLDLTWMAWTKGSSYIKYVDEIHLPNRLDQYKLTQVGQDLQIKGGKTTLYVQKYNEDGYETFIAFRDVTLKYASGNGVPYPVAGDLGVSNTADPKIYLFRPDTIDTYYAPITGSDGGVSYRPLAVLKGYSGNVALDIDAAGRKPISMYTSYELRKEFPGAFGTYTDNGSSIIFSVGGKTYTAPKSNKLTFSTSGAYSSNLSGQYL